MNFLKICFAWVSYALRSRAKFVLRMSITVRLACGFIFAALLAATATGVVEFQRTSLLHTQANFYEMLLENNTTLITSSDYLKSIQDQMTKLLTAVGTSTDESMIVADEQGLDSLVQRYNRILMEYTTHGLLLEHPEQRAVLTDSNPKLLVEQQQTYAAGALQTWYIYEKTQENILHDVEDGNLSIAQYQAHFQSERDFHDAQSALRSLIQFNTDLAASADGATNSSANTPLLEAFFGGILVFFGVILLGFLISHSLISRLKALHRVTRAVRQGQKDTRVILRGADEITDVSSSVNTMLDELVTALQEATTAREQTDLAYAQQRQLNEMKNQFILHVSHELRTPLTQVYGFLELLKEYQGQLDAGQEEYFTDQALKGCEELLTMCGAILDTSEQAAVIQSPRRSTVRLAPLAEELLAYWGSQERALHPVHLDIPGTLEVQADPQYLRQILRNLLSNAFKYTPVNQPVFLEATLLEGPSGGQNSQKQALIRVRDTGPGISREDQSMLFQQFVRLKRDLAGTVRGSGLGLYLCRQFVEAMGGRIWVESTGIPGEGSIFCFTLPVVYPLDEPSLHLRQALKEMP